LIKIYSSSYLQTKEDLAKLVRGARLCFKIARTEPLASHLDVEEKRLDLDHQLHLKTDEDIEAIIRERVGTVFHPTSTCRMAPLEEGGVVDGKLRVYGIPNLRICDASIFPSIVSGHTVSGTRDRPLFIHTDNYGYFRLEHASLPRRNSPMSSKPS
jgi:choline dehydrogenase